ncbi:MAG TPA: fumarate hydratase [Methanospirillum sp.]|uniref:fumarate hydratase n=1 Tax=Methanospirillum sp. TaxID=45200 RepID=UPI002BFB49AC|nr:fumarate hydratase [Methanospirillum sp.]HWQ64058.1 fumarate hydratase [Methanospirillum sp.]
MSSPVPSDLSDRIAAATASAIRIAEITLPPDVLERIFAASEDETSPVARRELMHILENIRLAEERQAPICQDTGIPVIYLTLPPQIPFTSSIVDAVRKGVREATETIPLRPNLVDPITRHNTGTNTSANMPAVHILPGDRMQVTVLPKGAGSENVSRLKMFTPTEKDRIPEFVVETALLAGGRPCPPIILGVGIGGTFDGAASLAKEALLEPLDQMTPEETEICQKVNDLGIGPMGLGGKTTCLGVKIKSAGCHTASLPVAVNIQCWAARRATVEVPLS